MSESIKAEADKVLVISASVWAKDDYDNYGAYIWGVPPERPFLSTANRIAFYYKGRILKHVPLIKGFLNETVQLDAEADAQIDQQKLGPDFARWSKQLIRKLQEDAQFIRGSRNRRLKFMWLSSGDDPETCQLQDDVLHDGPGRYVWGIQFRHVPLEKLKQATKTSQLKDI